MIHHVRLTAWANDLPLETRVDVPTDDRLIAVAQAVRRAIAALDAPWEFGGFYRPPTCGAHIRWSNDFPVQCALDHGHAGPHYSRDDIDLMSKDGP